VTGCGELPNSGEFEISAHSSRNFTGKVIDQLIPGESRRMNLNNDIAVVAPDPCGSGRFINFIPAVPAA
jgi:hypothetical protein